MFVYWSLTSYYAPCWYFYRCHLIYKIFWLRISASFPVSCWILSTGAFIWTQVLFLLNILAGSKSLSSESGNQFSSVQFSHSVMSDYLKPHESQHARPPCPSPSPGVHSNSRPSSRWCHPAISSSVIPFSSCPQSLPDQGLFQWVNSSHEVAKVLEFQLQHQSFQWTPRTDLLQNGLVGSPCSPRDSQESPPTPQFKSISSLSLSCLHSPTLTSIHDHWKNHSLD